MSWSSPLLRVVALSTPLLLSASLAHAQPSSAAAAEAGTTQQNKKKRKKNNKGKKSKTGKKGKKGKHKARALCAQLQCSDTQAQQIAQRLRTLRQGRSDAERQRLALQTALSRELAKASPSKKELKRIRADADRLRSKRFEDALDALLDIHAMLEPGQREALARVVEQRGVERALRGGGRKHGQKTAKSSE